MNKQNVKRVVCVHWAGLLFIAGRIYSVDELGHIVDERGERLSGYSWDFYNKVNGTYTFRPVYKNDLES